MCHVSCVTCPVSRVTGHLSHVTCHLSHVKIFLFKHKKNLKKWAKLVELVGGGSVINGAYPV